MLTTPFSFWRRAAATPLLAALSVAAMAAPGAYELVTTVGADGKLEGCGVRIARPDGATATITLHRQDLRGATGALELSATLPAVTAPPTAITLTTTNAGEIAGFVVDDAKDAMPTHARANVEPDAAALLMRDVMLKGVTVSVHADDDARAETAFEGPAALEVIRGYLQCAGNMGR